MPAVHGGPSETIGQLIMVHKIQGLDPDWLLAERGTQRGKVPVTYLEVLE